MAKFFTLGVGTQLASNGARIERSFSGDYRIDVFIDGPDYRWNAPLPVGTPTTVSYSFMNAAPSYLSASDAEGFAPFTLAQQQAVRQILAQVSAFTQLQFQEVSDSAASHGQIRLGNNYQSGTSGYAYFPNAVAAASPDAGYNGNVWISNELMSETTLGTWGYATLVHELGHALGLDHPGDYNAGSAPDPASISNFLGPTEDNTAYTVMSYTDVPQGQQRVDYGMFDILALQYLYGAKAAYTEDTIWRMTDADGQRLQTLVDSGGADTLDLSALGVGASADLRDGHFSSVGLAASGALAVNNLSFALGSVIEKVVGTSTGDVVMGNDANNTFTGGGGMDTLTGGAGVDTAVYQGPRADYTGMVLAGAPIKVVDGLLGRDGTDTLASVERLVFADQCLAFDLDGTAGQAARLIGVLLGPQTLGVRDLVGKVIAWLDTGSTPAELAALGLDAMLGPQRTQAETAHLLVGNVFGMALPALEETVTGWLRTGLWTETALTVMAAGLDEVAARINLVGLQQTGLEYTVA